MKLLIEHVLEVLGAEVRGVRVEGLGQARQIDFHQLAGVDLVGLAVAVAIADRPLSNRFGVIDVVDDLGEEQVELDLLAEPLVGLGLIDGIVDLLGSSLRYSSTVKSCFCLSSSIEVLYRSSCRWRKRSKTFWAKSILPSRIWSSRVRCLLS